MTRSGPFPGPDENMHRRDEWGLKDQGGSTNIPWTKPDPEPATPVQPSDEVLENIRKAFQ